MTAAGAAHASLSLIERLARLPKTAREACLAGIPDRDRLRLLSDWRFLARPEQLPPPGDWSVWLILAGRGFGKTRAGAEWVTARALAEPGARIALVGATLADVEGVMVGGESGLLAVAPEGFKPTVVASKRRLAWPNGAIAQFFSAQEANRLRGPQFHFGWCDEIAAWPNPKAAWDNLRLGLRLGNRPRLMVTTTPRPTAFLRALMVAEGTVVTRGTTFDNRVNLPTAYLADMEAAYGGTAIGRQEVGGEVLETLDGALWSRDGIERCRKPAPGELRRIVVGVDPPAGAGTCGIVVAGLGPDDRTYVLADASVSETSPLVWARAVRAAWETNGADLVVVETNNGGSMVAEVLKGAGIHLPLKEVKATVGKAARAEPVAALYARGLVFHARPFPELEDQMCGLLTGGGYVGPGGSPDRADALVWAVTELMLRARAAAPPTIRGF
ncbi:DNA-packaging protein [Thermaurantiacus sp.]